MMFGGMQKLTLLDFPGLCACTLFTYGCNLRCPFCHNASLVVSSAEAPLTEEDVLAFLKKRQGLLDGVCITGGEPLLQPDLPAFIEKVRDLGFKVKLDTNGTFPDRLAALIERGLLDYVAMDIKNAPKKYAQTVGVSGFRGEAVKQSAALLMEGRVPFEFRTTVVSPLHTAADFEEIGRWLAGDERYFLQEFVDSGDLIGEGMSACSHEEMAQFLAILQKTIPNAAWRGHEK